MYVIINKTIFAVGITKKNLFKRKEYKKLATFLSEGLF